MERAERARENRRLWPDSHSSWNLREDTLTPPAEDTTMPLPYRAISTGSWGAARRKARGSRGGAAELKYGVHRLHLKPLLQVFIVG